MDGPIYLRTAGHLGMSSSSDLSSMMSLVMIGHFLKATDCHFQNSVYHCLGGSAHHCRSRLVTGSVYAHHRGKNHRFDYCFHLNPLLTGYYSTCPQTAAAGWDWTSGAWQLLGAHSGGCHSFQCHGLPNLKSLNCQSHCPTSI